MPPKQYRPRVIRTRSSILRPGVGPVPGRSRTNRRAWPSWQKRASRICSRDLLPEDRPERLMELIRLCKCFGSRMHAWHWMMSVGSAKECRELPDSYSVNRLGQSCRDFHPYVGYYNFLSPFSPGAREYVKKG